MNTQRNFIYEGQTRAIPRSRLAIVDDHPLIRVGLRARLEVEPDDVVGEAGSGSNALVLALENQPDLMLVDICMKDMDGIALTAELHRRHPAIPVLIFSMYDSVEHTANAVRAGARGYVLKEVDSRELVAAIRAVLTGGTHFSKDLARAIVEPLPPKLTRRQRQVLPLVAEGFCSKIIGLQLGISYRTVESHRLNIRRKLNRSTISSTTASKRTSSSLFWRTACTLHWGENCTH